jgi:hypothetical protein
MEEIQENPSLQIKENKVLTNDQENMKQIWNYCIAKGKNEGLIVGMPYVGLFSMWMIMQKWHLVYFKSCVNNCMLCYSNIMFSFNPRMKLKKGLIIYHKKWNNMHEKTCWCKTFRNFEKFLTWINLQWKDVWKNNLLKKDKYIRFIHFLFFCVQRAFQKQWCQPDFLENLTFLVV